MKHLVLIAAAPLLVAQAPKPDKLEVRLSAPEAAPARDGNIAIQEELCAARKAATAAAYDLFIARHPQHPLADEARAERAKLPRQ